MKKIVSFIAVLTLLLTISGCREKQVQQTQITTDTIELTIYNVFDNEDIFTPVIQAFRSEYGNNIKINYRKFSDLTQYRDIIINELAEGEGPDIFFMHNSWFYKDHKKLTPAPSTVTKQDFLDSYVDVAANDLIVIEPDGSEFIYSFPLYVDTLAMYYNKSYYNAVLPERSRPPRTWSELEEDIFKLKKQDNSFERFSVAGASLGRSDNILRSTDILLALMLQYGINFYDDDYSRVDIAGTQGINAFGQPNTPGLDALEFYTSFGLPSNRNYTWNSVLSDAASAEQEIDTFVKGKAAIIFGYSYLYEEIARQITLTAKRNPNTIGLSDVAVAPMPQVFDPEEDPLSSATFTSYFTPVVSRTTDYPDVAWAFISFMTNQENSRYYHEETHRPAARRDLIPEQSEDPIYGTFAKQTGIAKTIIMPEPTKYLTILDEAVNQVLATVPVTTALKNAQDEMNELMPEGGLFPEATRETVRERLEREASEIDTPTEE